ncbi:MAG: hypothetical protein ACYTKD_04495 [Planctomycetota bacterium]|jgi:hypothetical protein
MAIRTKKAFGTLSIDHSSPDRIEDWPKAINVILSFEEALKLHLGLGQALGQLNSYNRATKAGRDAAVNLCIFTKQQRITINEDKVKA